MAFSVNTPISDGIVKQYPITFTNGIFSRPSVHVFVEDDVDGGGNQLERAFSFINDGLIELDVVAPTGKIVTIRRIMNKDEPAVDFVDGAILDELNLDEQADHLLNTMHEVLDGYGSESIQTDIDMNGHSITNVESDPTDPSSLATIGDIQNALLDPIDTSDVMFRAQNLADVANPIAARFNLGVDSSIDTVAVMKASEALVGTTLNTRGYSVVGDGGGAEYLVAVAQTVDEFGSHTLANGNVALLQNKGIIKAIQFGIFQNVVANQSPAIVAAIDSSILNELSLQFKMGDYLFDGITRTLDAGKVSIVCDEGRAVFKGTADLVTAGGRMFRFENSSALASPITVTSSVEVREEYIEVSDASEIFKGMVFHIASNILWPYDNRTEYFKGEKHLVKRVDYGLNRIYFYDLVRDNYTIAEITTIQAWHPNHYNFKGIVLDMSEFGGSVGLQLNRSAFDTIDNVEVIGKEATVSTAGVWLLDQISTRVSNYIARNIGGGTGGGYGIQDRGCVGVIIDGLESYGCRRAFDAHSQSGINSSPSRDCLVINYKIYGGGDYWPTTAIANYGLGNHGPSEGVIFGRGEIHDCLTGINFRGVNQTASGIDMYGAVTYMTDLTYGTGVDISNVNYRPAGFPNKGSTLGGLDTTYMPVALLRLGRVSTTDANADMSLPVTIRDCTCIGLVTSLIFSDGTTQPINNIYAYNNTVEPKTSASVFYLVSANGTFFNCSFDHNTIVRRMRDVALADIGIQGGTEPVIVDDLYMLRIEDQAASTVGTFMTSPSARLTLAISGDAGGRGMYQFLPNNAAITQAGHIVFSDLEGTASPDSLDGTFGNAGKFTVGLTPEGKVVAENRIGTGAVWRFKLLA